MPSPLHRNGPFRTGSVSARPAAATALLYVEDELLTQELVQLALQEAGYQVVVAENGAQALELIEKTSIGLIALITDVRVGEGPDGWHLARRARELFAGLAIIYTSGQGNREWMSNGVPHSVLISKPFAPAQVVIAVGALLNKAKG